MIDDEVRETLQALVDEIGAVSARIVEDDDVRTGVPAPAEWDGLAGELHELYLRLVISQRAPIAAVQQVAVTLTRGARADGGWLAREAPRAGVYDAPLLPRMQNLVATLPAYGLRHVDFGEIAHAPSGFHAGAWRDLYAGEPAIANYLFYPQPTTMVTSSWLEEPR